MDNSSQQLITLRKQCARRKARVKELEQQLQAMEQSLSWKATRPLRAFFFRFPRTSLAVRRVFRLIWWILTLQIHGKVRERLVRRGHPSPQGKGCCNSQETKIATPGALSRTVSVIVPNYNYAQYLQERISNIQMQSYPVRQIIILDDASTDDSVSVISTIQQNSGDRLSVFVNEKNSGSIARQWALGISLADGELVWIAEADDLADIGFLAAAVQAFDDPDVVLSYTQSCQIDSTGQVIDKDYSAYLDDFDPERWKRSYCRMGTAEISEMLSVGNTIPNVSAVVFKRSAIADVLSRHLDELSSLSIAVDWCCYLHVLQSGSIAFTAEVLNSHRRHPHSVISTVGLGRHLHEIQQMQRLAARLVNVPPDRIVAARLWYAAWAEMLIQEMSGSLGLAMS